MISIDGNPDDRQSRIATEHISFSDIRQVVTLYSSSLHRYLGQRESPPKIIFIDRVTGEIIRLVASVCVRFCFLWALSCLNRLIFDLDFWHDGRP